MVRFCLEVRRFREKVVHLCVEPEPGTARVRASAIQPLAEEEKS